jgi:short-subunit dehydrogenase
MSPTLKPLEDQVIVITGASSGIGLATAEMAASRGAKLVLAARSEGALSEVVARITESGGTAIAVVADVAEPQHLERIAEAARARFGRIDTWVNNAGVAIYGKLTEVPLADSRRLFDINFWGLVNGSLAALPSLRAGGGALINVGSEVSDAVVPLQGMYAASKHAVKGFTDALRLELQLEEAPVSVTLIQPTAVNTPYPQHARNYMEEEPKLPDPQIDPGKVAEAILHAAVHGGRDVTVGAMSAVNTTLAKLVPGLADKMAKKQAGDQHYAEPPRDPEGTLYKPGESGEVHGAGGVVPDKKGDAKKKQRAKR